jgi:hypothetical protein
VTATVFEVLARAAAITVMISSAALLSVLADWLLNRGG